MHIRKPRYSKEEFARMGTELYEKKIRPLVEQGNMGRIVAIDIETGDYELGDDPLVPCPAWIDGFDQTEVLPGSVDADGPTIQSILGAALDACPPLIARNPDSQIWCVRIGHRAVDRFGSVDTREKT